MTVNDTMSTRQIYNLRWNNHTNNMLQVFLEQLASERLVDVTLSCEGKFIRVHKIVLSACSPYFQELFDVHKEQSPVVILNNMKFEDLKSVVNFIYCGEIEVAESQMEGVLAVAEALQVKGLSDVRDSYESGQKREKDKDGEGNTKEMMEETVSKSSKKRKLQEKNLILDTDGETSTPRKESLSKEDKQIIHSEESNHEWNPDALIKEETLDIDPDDFEGSEEEAEIALEWKKQAEKAHSSAMDENLLQYDSPDIARNNNNVSNSEIELFPVITQVVGMTSKHLSTGNHNILDNTPKKPGEKIPRPPNAFMVFATEWRRRLASIHHGENNKDISIRLGAMWKKLPPNTKAAYFAAARKADEEHKQRYPGYTYNPKEARLRKVLRQGAYKNSKVSLINQSKDSASPTGRKTPPQILPRPN